MADFQAWDIVWYSRKMRELRVRQCAARRGQAFLKSIDQYGVGEGQRTRNRNRNRVTSVQQLANSVKNLSIESSPESQPRRDLDAKKAKEAASLGIAPEDMSDRHAIRKKYKEYVNKDRVVSNEIAALRAAKREYDERELWVPDGCCKQESDVMELWAPETGTNQEYDEMEL